MPSKRRFEVTFFDSNGKPPRPFCIPEVRVEWYELLVQ